MNYYTIGEFAKKIGVSQQTLRNWHKSGKLIPHHLSTSGYRMYSEEQVAKYELKNTYNPERKTVGYCRVFSPFQTEELVQQIDLVSSYMTKRGYQFQILEEVGVLSERKEFHNLICLVVDSKIDRIVVVSKDILDSTSYDLTEMLCKKFNTTIEVINQTSKKESAFLVHQFCNLLRERHREKD